MHVPNCSRLTLPAIVVFIMYVCTQQDYKGNLQEVRTLRYHWKWYPFHRRIKIIIDFFKWKILFWSTRNPKVWVIRRNTNSRELRRAFDFVDTSPYFIPNTNMIKNRRCTVNLGTKHWWIAYYPPMQLYLLICNAATDTYLHANPYPAWL